MAEKQGLPASPGANKGPGWYPVGGVNDQAYWDGEHWTRRRRWSGASWMEMPLEGGGAPLPAGTMTTRATGAHGRSSSRKSLVVGLVALVAAIGLAAGLVYATSSSSNRASSTSPPSSQSATTSSSPVTVPHQSAAVVASCEADAKSLEVALGAYMAQNGSFPSPPSAWSAATYSGNFAPLIESAHGGPYMHAPPATTNYLIEYDASGHVWIAPPGSYGVYDPGQDFDKQPNACFATTP